MSIRNFFYIFSSLSIAAWSCQLDRMDQSTQTHDGYQSDKQSFFNDVLFNIQSSAWSLYCATLSEQSTEILSLRWKELNGLRVAHRNIIQQMKMDSSLQILDENAQFIKKNMHKICEKMHILSPNQTIFNNYQDPFSCEIYNSYFSKTVKLNDRKMIYDRLVQLNEFPEQYIDWSFFLQFQNSKEIILMLDTLISLTNVWNFNFHDHFYSVNRLAPSFSKSDLCMLFVTVRFSNMQESFFDTFQFFKKFSMENANFDTYMNAFLKWEDLSLSLKETLGNIGVYNLETITELSKLSHTQDLDHFKKYMDYALSVLPKIHNSEDATLLITGYDDFKKIQTEIMDIFSNDFFIENQDLSNHLDNILSLSSIFELIKENVEFNDLDDNCSTIKTMQQIYKIKKDDTAQFMLDNYLLYLSRYMKKIFSDPFKNSVYAFFGILKYYEIITHDIPIDFSKDGNDALTFLDIFKKIYHLPNFDNVLSEIELIAKNAFGYHKNSESYTPIETCRILKVLYHVLEKGEIVNEFLNDFDAQSMTHFCAYDKVLLFLWWMKNEKDSDFLKRGLNIFEPLNIIGEDIFDILTYYKEKGIQCLDDFEERVMCYFDYLPQERNEQKLFLQHLPFVSTERLTLITKMPFLSLPVLHPSFAKTLEKAATMDLKSWKNWLAHSL